MDDANLTQVETVTLAATADRPRYGYELVQRIAELTDGRLTIRPGNLYRVLHRLQQRGLVRELTESNAPASTDPRRRYFSATPAGRRAAAVELAMYSRVLQRTQVLIEEAGSG